MKVQQSQMSQEVWSLKIIQAFHMKQQKAIMKIMTTLPTHNAVVSILMANFQEII